MARSMTSSSDGIRAQNVYGASSVSLPLTGACWFQPNANRNSYGTIIEIEDNSAASYTLFIGLSGTSNHLAYYNGISNAHLDPGTLSIATGVWAHVAVSVDGSGTASAYLNGVLDSGATFGTFQASTLASDFRVGLATSGGTANNGWAFADAAVWTTNLTAAEVLALANGARPGAIRPLSLKVWQPLDGLQSPEPDYSGHSFNGVLTGTAINASGPPVMQFTPRWPQFLTPSAGATVKPFPPFNLKAA